MQSILIYLLYLTLCCCVFDAYFVCIRLRLWSFGRQFRLYHINRELEAFCPRHYEC